MAKRSRWDVTTARKIPMNDDFRNNQWDASNGNFDGFNNHPHRQPRLDRDSDEQSRLEALQLELLKNLYEYVSPEPLYNPRHFDDEFTDYSYHCAPSNRPSVDRKEQRGEKRRQNYGDHEQYWSPPYAEHQTSKRPNSWEESNRKRHKEDRYNVKRDIRDHCNPHWDQTRYQDNYRLGGDGPTHTYSQGSGSWTRPYTERDGRSSSSKFKAADSNKTERNTPGIPKHKTANPRNPTSGSSKCDLSEKIPTPKADTAKAIVPKFPGAPWIINAKAKLMATTSGSKAAAKVPPIGTNASAPPAANTPPCTVTETTNVPGKSSVIAPGTACQVPRLSNLSAKTVSPLIANAKPAPTTVLNGAPGKSASTASANKTTPFTAKTVNASTPPCTAANFATAPVVTQNPPLIVPNATTPSVVTKTPPNATPIANAKSASQPVGAKHYSPSRAIKNTPPWTSESKKSPQNVAKNITPSVHNIPAWALNKTPPRTHNATRATAGIRPPTFCNKRYVAPHLAYSAKNATPLTANSAHCTTTNAKPLTAKNATSATANATQPPSKSGNSTTENSTPLTAKSAQCTTTNAKPLTATGAQCTVTNATPLTAKNEASATPNATIPPSKSGTSTAENPTPLTAKSAQCTMTYAAPLNAKNETSATANATIPPSKSGTSTAENSTPLTAKSAQCTTTNAKPLTATGAQCTVTNATPLTAKNEASATPNATIPPSKSGTSTAENPKPLTAKSAQCTMTNATPLTAKNETSATANATIPPSKSGTSTAENSTPLTAKSAQCTTTNAKPLTATGAQCTVTNATPLTATGAQCTVTNATPLTAKGAQCTVTNATPLTAKGAQCTVTNATPLTAKNATANATPSVAKSATSTPASSAPLTPESAPYNVADSTPLTPKFVTGRVANETIPLYEMGAVPDLANGTHIDTAKGVAKEAAEHNEKEVLVETNVASTADEDVSRGAGSVTVNKSPPFGAKSVALVTAIAMTQLAAKKPKQGIKEGSVLTNAAKLSDADGLSAVASATPGETANVKTVANSGIAARGAVSKETTLKPLSAKSVALVAAIAMAQLAAKKAFTTTAAKSTVSVVSAIARPLPSSVANGPLRVKTKSRPVFSEVVGESKNEEAKSKQEIGEKSVLSDATNLSQCEAARDEPSVVSSGTPCSRNNGKTSDKRATAAERRVRSLVDKAVARSNRRWKLRLEARSRLVNRIAASSVARVRKNAQHQQKRMLRTLRKLREQTAQNLLRVKERIEELEAEVELTELLLEGSVAGEHSKRQWVDLENLVEIELQCTICSEPFVKATTLRCSHTFCRLCLTQWKKTQKTCPICRANISSENPTLVLNTFIDKLSEWLSEDFRQRRLALLATRRR